MNIIEACQDEQLFRPFLGPSLASWSNWRIILHLIYGLPTLPRHSDFIRHVTGRSRKHLPPEGFAQSLLLTGRRSGKSRIAALCGGWEAILSGREKRVSKGEQPLVVIVSPSRTQSRIVKAYMRALFESPLLQSQVVNETQTAFELINGVKVEILAGDYRTIRGYTLLAAIVDEVCFFGLEADAKVKSDTELIRALLPGLATVGGRLIAISSPYARRGWSYQQYQRCFGNDKATTLVVNAASRVLNPTLKQSVVDAAMAEDLAAAKSEYLGEFRDDVSAFISRELVEELVIPGRQELMFDKSRTYGAFVDVSGGRGDDATLCIAHREGDRMVLDVLRRYRPPFNPQAVIRQMADELKRYRLTRVMGDAYAAEFVSMGFESCGIRYDKSPKAKSELYLELLPVLTSHQIELLDDDALINQLCSLERRTRSGGRDIVDHPAGPNHHDDLANVVAGVATVLATRVIVCGAF